MSDPSPAGASAPIEDVDEAKAEAVGDVLEAIVGASLSPMVSCTIDALPTDDQIEAVLIEDREGGGAFLTASVTDKRFSLPRAAVFNAGAPDQTASYTFMARAGGVGVTATLGWSNQEACQITAFQVEPIDEGEIICPFVLDDDVVETSFFSTTPFVEGEHRDGALIITGAAAGEGALYLTFEGEDAMGASVDVYWADGRCDPIEMIEPFILTGEIVPFDPTQAYSLNLCGVQSPVKTSRFSRHLTFEAQPCTFTAARMDGKLRAQSAPVTIEVTPGGAASVRFELPIEQIGGMGIGIASVEDGVQVTQLHADTPAEREGLAIGDVITAIDGISVAGMAVADFIANGTGPIGSEVTITVRRGEAEEQLTFRRMFIE
ncbi:MAG: PDZ domain-containing protein [Myxococcota bacterium]